MNQRIDSDAVPMQQPEQNPVRLALAIVCTLVSLPILCCCGFLFLDNFNAVSVKSIKSLEEGMTKEEIKAILGPPYSIGNEVWYYRVRNPSDIGTYSDSFAVHFDENGRKTNHGFWEYHHQDEE